MAISVAFIAGATANDTFRSAMALSEFDGLFVDPENLRDPDPSLRSRRRSEIEILLASGGAVVLFARPRVEIGTGVDNYSWLLNRPFNVVERPGKSVRLVDRESPFRPYFDTYTREVAGEPPMFFQVVLGDIPQDLPGRRILAENKAGEPIALLYRELNGTVAVIPPIREIDDNFRKLIKEVIRRLRERRSSIELAPGWVRALPPLPGESEQEAAIRSLDEKIASLTAQRDAELRALEDLRGLKALLWETGNLGLEPAVRQALSILGFEVEKPAESRSAALRAAIQLSDGDRVLFCEADASEEAIHLEGFRRLHESVTEALLERGVEAKGILVGNGYRLKPLESPERGATFSESCLSGCDKFRYAAVPTLDLYRAVESVLGGSNAEEKKAALRNSLMEASGTWRFER